MSKHSSLVIKDENTYRRFKSLCNELGKDIQDVVWQFIEKKVEEFDGKKNGLENFFDQNFVPIPQIDDDFETKILPWLRTLNDEKLTIALRNLNRGKVYTQALLDTPVEDRRNAGYDYNTIWRKYR